MGKNPKYEKSPKSGRDLVSEVYDNQIQDKYYLADKLAVRKYVQDMGLSGILVPLITVFDSGKVDLRKLSG